MGLSEAHRTSNRQDYETPVPFFLLTSDILGVKFTIDFAASSKNHLCDLYYTEEIDAFRGNWEVPAIPGTKTAGWTNPPYGDKKHPVGQWVETQFKYSDRFNYALLLPCNKLEQDWIVTIKDRALIGAVNGRIQYTINGKIPVRKDPKTGKMVPSGNSQGSLIVAFGPDIKPGFISIPWKRVRDELKRKKKNV